MPYFAFSDLKITGIASAVPTERVKVESFIPKFGEEAVKKFQEMTGIDEYRKTSAMQTASDLGYVAAETLLDHKKIDREKIGALIFVTHSPDYRRPASSFVLQKRLNIGTECAVYDINLGCSGFVYGLNTLCSLMQCSDIDCGLLIVAETVSKMAFPNDRSTAMLFGDAGSAILVEKQEDSTIRGLFRSDGRGYKAIIAPAGGYRNMYASTEPMMWPDGNERTLFNTNMNGTDVFNFTISDVPKLMKNFMEISETTVDDYDTCVLHQANKFIHKQISRKLKMSLDKMPLSIGKYGNTSGPSIPLTLCEEYGKSESRRVSVLMCGFGVGLSWGVISATMGTDDILPVVETDDYFAEGVINSPESL